MSSTRAPRKRQRKQRAHVEPHLWWRAAQCVLIAMLAVLAGADVLTRAHASLILLCVVGGVAAAVIWLSVLAHTGAESLALAWLAAVSAFGSLGWLIYARVTGGPWHEHPLTALLLGGLVLTPVSVLAYAAHKDAERQAARARELAENKARLETWRELLDSVGVHVTVTHVVATRSGHNITIRVPKSGSVQFQTLQDAKSKIAIALDLKDPDWVRFDQGRSAAEFVMHVQERDVMADEIPYPGEVTPISVNDPFDIGVADDGTISYVLLREICVLIVGVRGSGKTNLLNVIIAQLARCVDAIVWGIDLKGGALLAPWVKPWVNGKCARPVIDWIATDRDEADKMLNAMINVIQSRSKALAGDKDKITPSTDWPAYVFIVDEVAEIWSTAEPAAYREARTPGAPSTQSLAWLGTRVVNTGRAAAVDGVMGALRSTTTNLPSDIKAQCDARIALKVTTIAEAQNLIPDDASVAKAAAKAKHAGTSVFWRKGRPARADKIYRLAPEKVEHIAIETGDNIRPAPNKHDLVAMGDDYANRWKRAAPVLDLWRHQGPPLPGDFGTIVAQLPDPEAGHSPARKRAVEIVAEAGALGIRPGMIQSKLAAEGFGTTRETVQRWLADDDRVERHRHGMWRIDRRDRKTGTTG